jgi:hypothetical protein
MAVWVRSADDAETQTREGVGVRIDLCAMHLLAAQFDVCAEALAEIRISFTETFLAASSW